MWVLDWNARVRRVAVTVNGPEDVATLASGCGAHTDPPQKVASRLRNAPEHQRARCSDGGVDAIFNVCEDRHEYARKEDDHFKGADAPERIDRRGRCDQISHSVNDDRRKGSVGDVEENGRQSVKREDDHDARDQSRQGRSHTGL